VSGCRCQRAFRRWHDMPSVYPLVLPRAPTLPSVLAQSPRETRVMRFNRGKVP
jgi:hypothetical protein